MPAECAKRLSGPRLSPRPGAINRHPGSLQLDPPADGFQLPLRGRPRPPYEREVRRHRRPLVGLLRQRVDDTRPPPPHSAPHSPLPSPPSPSPIAGALKHAPSHMKARGTGCSTVEPALRHVPTPQHGNRAFGVSKGMQRELSEAAMREADERDSNKGDAAQARLQAWGAMASQVTQSPGTCIGPAPDEAKGRDGRSDKAVAHLGEDEDRCLPQAHTMLAISASAAASALHAS